MKIYQFSGSAYAWRVLLACAAKGLNIESDVEVVNMQPTQADLKSAAFLKLNRRGKVPVLQDGNFVITESMAAVAYLDKKIAGVSLFGETAEDFGLIWRLILDFDLYVAERIVQEIIVPIVKEDTDRLGSRIQSTARYVHSECRELENSLGDKKWFTGEHISAADIAIYPLLEALIRFASKPSVTSLNLGFDHFSQTYPMLNQWRQHVQTIPGYGMSYPKYWAAVDRGEG